MGMKTVFFLFGLAVAKSPIESKEEANTLLRVKRAPGIFDSLLTTAASKPKSYKESQLEAADAFMEKYNLNSVEAWEEMKDKFEENDKIPEENVDELEGCVAKCRWADRFGRLMPGDKSVEEQKENREEEYEKTEDPKVLEKKIVSCTKCFRYIPTEPEAGVVDGALNLLGGGGLGDIMKIVG